ncbi:HlyD family efflux transporter periplasmic adaptor subunit [Pseudomonas akapageensis]|uniref:HlyD family efflux transporter periplasmic adaptor subunit n=1 Tax=Pseudomonas akapageensis TaxID=2609961 RepID=UPI001408F4A0|nr:HlyD family efflux transporter periplasmic adaptor subunit [Pseudomonas akapageensis]
MAGHVHSDAARPTGLWLDVNPDWKPGQWIGRQEPLGVLIDPIRWQVDAYVDQDKVHRLVNGGIVRFYPDGQPTPVTGRVIAIGSTRINQLTHRMLSSRYGGPLPTSAQETALVPTAPVFQVLVQLDAPLPSLRETRGHLKIEGKRRSLLADGATHVLAVLLRESGF